MSYQSLSPASKAEEQQEETKRVSDRFSREYVVPDLNLLPEETEMDITAPQVQVYTRRNRIGQKHIRNEKSNQVSDRNTRQKLSVEEKDMNKSITHSKSSLPEVAKKTEVDPQLTPAQGSLAIKMTDKVEGGKVIVHGDYSNLDVVNVSFKELKVEAQQAEKVITELTDKTASQGELC